MGEQAPTTLPPFPSLTLLPSAALHFLLNESRNYSCGASRGILVVAPLRSAQAMPSERLTLSAPFVPAGFPFCCFDEPAADVPERVGRRDSSLVSPRAHDPNTPAIRGALRC
jgi:hypothetical protein